MSIQFSNGTITTTSFLGDTTAHLIAGIQTALTASGWTVISGGGTTNLQMQTATTPQGLAMRFRFHDNGLTVSSIATVQCSIQNLTGTIIGLDNSLQAPWVKVNGASNYRIICGPYYFWLVVPGVFNDWGQFACGGVPWTASFQSGTTSLGYVVAQNHGNATVVPLTFRTSSFCCGNGSPNPPCQQLISNSVYTNTDSAFVNSDGNAAFLKPWGMAIVNDNGGNGSSHNSLINNFSDGSFPTADPWMAWGIQRNGVPNAGDPSSINGMLWDAVYIYDSSQAGDTTATFDGHNWYAITNLVDPTLWVATS